jgi:hypothetical protein
VSLNIHVHDPLCVTLKFVVTDRLWDLRLAFWETQLQDLYPTAQITSECDHVHNQAHVKIEFDSQEDATHWYLTNDHENIHNQLLTDVNHMLSCVHEQEIGNLRIN